MGGTDADRSEIAERQKPPLPPKPSFITSHVIIDSTRHKCTGILSTSKLDEGFAVENVDNKGITCEETKECQMHGVETNQLSTQSTISDNMEKTSHTEPSVNSSLPSSPVSTLSSDRTGTRRTASGRSRPRRTSRHSLENGESGDEACCIRFAGMLRNKAVDVATKSKILPPPKPPKPDHLVKSKARRRKGSQQNGVLCQRSVGDDFSIDGSCHGVRFVDDDETESSTDYKDFDENSVFLLELACHCDAQNISKGTGILTEGVESGYYTSDVVKTDEETNLSDNSKVAVQNVDEQASPFAGKSESTENEGTFASELSFEKEVVKSVKEIGSQAAEESLVSCEDHLDSEKNIIANSSDGFISNREQPENQAKPMQKPKRVKSPPRPPPPQTKKHGEPVVTTEQAEQLVIPKEKVVSDGEAVPIHNDKEIISEKTKKDGDDEKITIGETKEEGIPSVPEIVDSVKSDQDIPVTETPKTKKRVTSPPRPPPPKIKEVIRQTGDEAKDLKQEEPVITKVEQCVVSGEELVPDGEDVSIQTDKEIISEKTIKEDDGKIAIGETKEGVIPSLQGAVDSTKTEQDISVAETPKTKKRVTSPPRPPPPKIKEVVSSSARQTDDEAKDLKQDDDLAVKKLPPPIPTKPERKQKEILSGKSSLEPLDLSTTSDVDQPTKPSLSPKTFPRSSKQRLGKTGAATTPVRKMEFPSRLKPSEQAASKPIMTTVVRNTYLDALQPLPSAKSPTEKKPLPPRPPLPVLAKTEENKVIDGISQQDESISAEIPIENSETIESTDATIPENTHGVPEAKLQSLDAVKDSCIEQPVSNVENEIQKDHVQSIDIPLQDAKEDDKVENAKSPDSFVRGEVQFSTWPSAAERKKRKQMKSPPRPPPPSKDALIVRAESFTLQKETLPQQAYETSSLDSRGRKRIKSPPRPPPPNTDKLSPKTEVRPVSEGKTVHYDISVENGTKRVKSPPRPPPPVKSSVEQVVDNRLDEAVKFTDNTTCSEICQPSSALSESEKAAPSVTEEKIVVAPLAAEESIADVDLSLAAANKKRIASPPRPPPPVYEKLSMRLTDKPIISTTPRTRKSKETLGDQKQFMSLQRPSGISASSNSKGQSQSPSVVLHEYEEIKSPDEEGLDSLKTRPKPPPRVKRNRSRTVEVVCLTEKPGERKQRSHSLTEADVLRKLEDRGLLSAPQKSEMKTIYTTVQKEHGKAKLREVDANEEGRRTPGSDKMKLRPLPPPPPPPRCRSRSSTSRSPTSPGMSTSLSEEVKLNLTQEDSCGRTEPTIQKQGVEYDENANISVPSAEPEQRKQEISCSENSIEKNNAVQIEHCDQMDHSKTVHKKSPSPSSARSKSPSPSKHRSCSSWYDESDVSGDLGDVDTSSSIKGSAEAINKDDLELSSKPKQSKSKNDQSRTSTFYYDLDDDAFHDCATEFPLPENERPVSSCSLVEKSVQTSPERELGLSGQERNAHSDDTDDLLDRARSVQNELCLMLERRKRKKGRSRSGEDDSKSSCSYTPSPKSTMSRNKVEIVCDSPATEQSSNIELPLAASPVIERTTKFSNTHSSNSELAWQELSSDESDEDNDEASSILQKKKRKAFQIANEIMTSEESFISSLRLLNEDFRSAVDKANRERGGTVISEEALNSFLKYFPQLQHLNESLLSELKERIKHWEETEKIADIIVKIGPFLKLYSSYIRDFDVMEAALMEARRRYPLFDQVTKEFESGPQCKKLALNHYMLRPVQRIPLYQLLLQQYLQNLTPDSPDYSDTLTALQIVSQVADHANETLKQGDNFQKLILIQNSLLSRYEVIRPGRVFLKEGELMKLSRKEMQPRWFILFSDSLLYLTSVQQGLFKVINELPLAGMKVHIPQHEDYHNEFSIISVTRSFTLAARSLEERQEWIDALNKAIEENASKRSSFATVMMQQKGKDIQSGSSFVLGRQAPVWIPDSRVTMCQLCTSEFTVTFRRHHCRACGKVVCSLCSANRAPLQYRNFSVARVCDECFEKLQKEFEAVEPSESIAEESGSCSEVADNESDSPNAMASIKAQFKGNAKNAGKKNKRQLPKVLKEVCANDQGSTISGYLHRRHRKYWKRFWFVLKDKVLYTYKASEDVAALESVPLLGYQVETFKKPFEGAEAELLFQLTHPGQDPIIFYADTIVSSERWIQAMQHATILE